jgi:three-Cys-motif partner protein
MDENAREALYEGREQTLVKHLILQKYLECFAHIVGMKWESITYVDCFSGPWNLKSENLEDSSFAIALNELRKARESLKKFGRELQLRCFFIEKNRQSYARLKAFADATTDATVDTKNSRLEDAIEDIVDFVRKGGSGTFPFIFIDPTGWTGFAMETIRPLLQLRPGEVLINFMTGHIQRFILSPLEESHDSFRTLFGADSYRELLAGKEQQDREDAAVALYMRNLKKTGEFTHVCCAIVLHPEFDRTHFHLIYATRNVTGVEVFKDAEKQAMMAMEKARAEAQQRRRELRTGQSELFESAILHRSTHYESLRNRYLTWTERGIRGWLEAKKQVSYDRVWERALSVPMVWESDLRRWLSDWSDQGLIHIKGLKPKERVPKRRSGVVIIWCETTG